MVVVREQERAVRYRMRSIYIHGNRHVMGLPWPPEMLMACEQRTLVPCLSPFVAS